LDLERNGSCKIWIMQEMNHARFELCMKWIVKYLDQARFGLGKIWVGKIWIVQDLDRLNLDHARFRLSKIWILLYTMYKIMNKYFKNDFNPLYIYNLHRPLWIIWCGITGPLRLVLHCYTITFSLHLLTPNFVHTFKQSVWYNPVQWAVINKKQNKSVDF
jgi:hypothetical protein